MIGQIRGVLVDKASPPEILVDAGGLVYEVQVPMSTLYRLPEPGGRLTLHTHFAVREDAQQLYGFWRARDKAMFRALVRVSGVGPRIALAILSGMESEEFVRTVLGGDVDALVGTPGVGRRTAERLVVEMRGRLAEWEEEVPAAEPEAGPARSAARDAESALVTLGYRRQQAAKAVAAALRERPGTADLETLIRLALKGMVR